jgi:transcriptional regulator with XRE-family HTH domain
MQLLVSVQSLTMNAQEGSPGPQAAAESDAKSSLGAQLRTARQRQGVTLRALAKQTGVSASLLSRIETDKTQPSVSTLYAVVSALGMSLDALFSATDGYHEAEPAGARTIVAAPPGAEAELLSVVSAIGGTDPIDLLAGMQPGIQRASDRATLTLESGVTWERLTSQSHPAVDFLFVTYEVDGSSNSSGHLMRHPGVEWTYVVSGLLEVTVIFEKYLLRPGDTITFHSSTPHRLANAGTEPVQAICVIFGRQSLFPH